MRVDNMAFETQYVERKVLSILRVLNDSPKPLGARVIAQRLKEHGVELGERAVRYHLKMTDERGLTHLVGRRDGRSLTEQGAEEVGSALVKDKVGFALSRIELLAFRTTFDCEKRSGLVPVNISFFRKDKFAAALQAMKPAFEAGMGVSDLVATASEGEGLGDLTVPRGYIGLATVCSIIINGSLLKAGIPTDSRFGGVLQVRNKKPLRFVELIHYAGSSMDPSEIFIRAKMTSVAEVARIGSGKVLANFREIPVLSRPLAQEVLDQLNEAGMGGILVMGNTSDSVCEVPVEFNKVGIVLLGGMNPVAAAEEAGIGAEHYAMSTLVEYRDMTKFSSLLNKKTAVRRVAGYRSAY